MTPSNFTLQKFDKLFRDGCTRTRTSLENGLTVVYIEQPHLHQVSLSLFFRTGSRFETEAENGLSHFVEHMLFRGTEKFATSYDLNWAFERIGGTLYAATGADSTMYEVTLPAGQLERGIELLSEVATSPRFGDLEIERRVISEEAREDLDEHDKLVEIDYLSRRRLWPEHPLGQSIIGPVENIHRFSLGELRAWYRKCYTAQNGVLCISGCFNRKEISGSVEQRFSKIPSGQAPLEFTAPGRAVGPTYEHTHKTGSQTHTRIAFHAPGLADEDHVPFNILLGIFDDGMSTRLHRRIFDELGLAYHVSAESDVYVDVGVVNVEASSGHENVLPTAEAMLQLLTELKSERPGPTEEELSKAKDRAVWALESLMDDPHGMAAWFGEQELFLRPSSLEARAGQISKVTLESLRGVAQKYFVPQNLHITTVGVLGETEVQALEKLAFKFGS